jgi:hypothetical protein
MLESANRYATTSRDFMTRANRYLDDNDLHQASEKGWGAAAQMVKAIAEERGWPHDSHRLLYRTIDDLVSETGDSEVARLFKIASDLHINYYENWWSANAVRGSLEDIETLLGKLEPLIEERL